MDLHPDLDKIKLAFLSAIRAHVRFQQPQLAERVRRPASIEQKAAHNPLPLSSRYFLLQPGAGRSKSIQKMPTIYVIISSACREVQPLRQSSHSISHRANCAARRSGRRCIRLAAMRCHSAVPRHGCCGEQLLHSNFSPRARFLRMAVVCAACVCRAAQVACIRAFLVKVLLLRTDCAILYRSGIWRPASVSASGAVPRHGAGRSLAGP